MPCSKTMDMLAKKD